MKVYVSGAEEDEEECIKIADKFEREGHIITRKWWNYKSDDTEVLKAYVNMDKKAIKECDLFVLYNGNYFTSGRYIELGMALILDKMVYVYGKHLTTMFRYGCYNKKLDEVDCNDKKE